MPTSTATSLATPFATSVATSAVFPLVIVAALALVACDPRPGTPPAPKVDTASTVVLRSGSSDPSLPPSDTATPAAAPAASNADATSGRSLRAMSPAQQSGAMPLPGQANDHSAPLAPAKPASAR